jgi:hypothetical protein
VKLKAPENCGGFTAGQLYEVDEDGTIDVPTHLVDTARSHGFTDYVPPAPKKGKQEKTEQKGDGE